MSQFLDWFGKKLDEFDTTATKLSDATAAPATSGADKLQKNHLKLADVPVTTHPDEPEPVVASSALAIGGDDEEVTVLSASTATTPAKPKSATAAAAGAASTSGFSAYVTPKRIGSTATLLTPKSSAAAAAPPAKSVSTEDLISLLGGSAAAATGGVVPRAPITPRTSASLAAARPSASAPAPLPPVAEPTTAASIAATDEKASSSVEATVTVDDDAAAATVQPAAVAALAPVAAPATVVGPRSTAPAATTDTPSASAPTGGRTSRGGSPPKPEPAAYAVEPASLALAEPPAPANAPVAATPPPPFATAAPVVAAAAAGGGASRAELDNLQSEITRLSGEVSTLTDELTAMRQAWNDSRKQVAHAKQVLINVDEQHKKKLKEREAALTATHDAEREKWAQEMKTLKRDMESTHEEFRMALKAKNSFNQSQEQDMKSTKQRMELYEKEANDLNARIVGLEAERDELIRQQTVQSEAHAKLLRDLRDEEKKTQSEIEKEKNMHQTILKTATSRESELEATHIGYANALAAAHRELEDKSRELQRIVSEKRWIEADHAALGDQLTAARTRAEHDTATATKTIATLTAQLKAAIANATEAQNALNALQPIAKRDRERADEATAKLTALSSPDGSGAVSGADAGVRITELERQVRTMADSLLQKSSYIDRVSGERSSLKLQLEQESKRVLTLEQNLRTANARIAAAEAEDGTVQAAGGGGGSGGGDLEGGNIKRRVPGGSFGSASSDGDLKTRTVQQAVTMLDSAGLRIGAALRRHPSLRIGFGVYVILVHLWLIFVLYHLMGDMNWVDPHDAAVGGRAAVVSTLANASIGK